MGVCRSDYAPGSAEPLRPVRQAPYPPLVERWRPGRRHFLTVVAVLLLVVTAYAAWLVVRGVQVRGDLESARHHLAGAQLDVAPAALARTQARVAAAGTETASARARTADPLWRLGELLPAVGDDLAAVRVLAASVDTVVAEVATPLLDVGTSVDPSSLRRDDGSFDLAPLAAAGPRVDAAAAALRAADATLRSLDRAGLAEPVAAALDEASSQVEDLLPFTDGLARTVRLLPGMLGHEGPRHYFLAFQNPAEARGTGGIVGVYGVVEVDAGRVRLVRMGANDDLVVLDEPPVDLGEEYRGLYGTLPRDSDNANLSPHFPYMARNLLGLWRDQTGERLDGLVSVDPLALERLLRVNGPVELSTGETVRANRVVELTLSEVYARFDEDQSARRDFLASVVRAVFDQLSAPGSDPLELVRALREPVQQHRVLVYSSHAAEQRELERSGLGGSLPPADAAARGIVVNNAAANKLDYYLDRTVRYVVGCTEAGRTRTTMTVALHNAAPARGLPVYVTSHLPALGDSVSTNRLIVSAFLPASTGMAGVRVDGTGAGATIGTERGYEVFSVTVDVPAGRTVEIEWSLDEPAVGDVIRLLEQPLVRPLDQTVEHFCSHG